MAGYLEAYGEAEQKHARNIRTLKWTAAIVCAVLIIGLILFSTFHNYREERQVRAFIDLLKNKDFQSAYHMWGCTDATPCRDYNFKRFMDDWGPNSPHADAAAAKIDTADSCGTGVVIPVEFQGTEAVPLWVERDNQIIGFSPDPECRKRRLHIREFFSNLFHKS
ncbi:MAG: hypothetical protein JO022_21860 [Acidobacteriaceae bacterium]|nr:hypothetical protein [Acidobacteriaceae bacterium]